MKSPIFALLVSAGLVSGCGSTYGIPIPAARPET